jgi:hypothetical protein
MSPAAAATTGIKLINKAINCTTMPTPMLTSIHVSAFLEALLAPSKSPAAALVFTCAAKMIAGMPKGKQQQSVEIMAPTK